MNIENSVILVVDDDLTNLDVLFDIFDATNFEVSYVSDGESCLEIANADPPDLILLDIMMPGMDGFEVCRRLKASEKTRDIPVIFMTALADTVNTVRGFELGAVDYITKPIQTQEVLARVRTHLTIRHLQKDLHVKNEELQVLLDRERELNALKSRFISIASHEFRSPLSLIGVTTNMLKRYSDRIPDEKKVEHLKTIEHSVTEMIDLLDNVLILLKAEAGNFRFHPVSVDIESFCQGIVEKFRIMSEETHTIVFSGPGAHFPVAADPKLLRHILANLLSNAIKYSPAGSTIYFELSQSTDEIIFRVKDEGIGISKTEQQHLFDAFHRGENVGKIKGTGLGLSIVKQFVDLHGGTIDVESEANEGTTVTVTIPFLENF